MNVLGVDPGIARCGWAVVSLPSGEGNVRVEDAGTFTTTAKQSYQERLLDIHAYFYDIIQRYATCVGAIEGLYAGSNATSVIGVARASGVILLAAEQHCVVLEEYAPQTIKKTVTGNGRATKAMVKSSVALQTGYSARSPDTNDAIAVALSYCVKEGHLELE